LEGAELINLRQIATNNNVEINTLKVKDVPFMYIYRARRNIGKKGLGAIILVHGGGGFAGNGLAEGVLMS